MATLDQLIEMRLQERRQERAEFQRQVQEARAEEERREGVARHLFVKRFKFQYEIDLPDSCEVKAEMSGEPDRFEFVILLNPPEEYPQVRYTYSFILDEVEGRLEVIRSEDLPWDGWRDGDDWRSADNPIDAFIFALKLDE